MRKYPLTKTLLYGLVLLTPLSLQGFLNPALAQSLDQSKLDCGSGDPLRMIPACTTIFNNPTVTAGDRAIATNNLASAYVTRGNNYLSAGQFDLAIADYKSVMPFDKQAGTAGLASAYITRGNSYLSKGQFDLAVADYKSAMPLDQEVCDQQSRLGLRHSWQQPSVKG